MDYKDLEFRILYDVYNVDDVVNYGWIVPRYSDNFESVGMSAKYDYKLSEAVSITPKIIYAYQEPWKIDLAGEPFKISTQRTTANVTAVGSLGALGLFESIDLLGGVEFYYESAKAGDLPGTDENTYYGGNSTQGHENYSAFLQTEFNTEWADLTVGGRYHYHSKIGGKFVPRLALTRVWEKFHLKGLFSQAFRTPQIEIITYGGVDGNGDPTIKSETTTSVEVEAGYRVSEHMSVVVNAFYIDITDILVYTSLTNSYSNFDSVANYGFEAEMRFADTWGSFTLGYSYYRNYRNDVPAFCTSGGVNGDPDYADCGTTKGLLLGFPAHKLTYNGTYLLTDRLSINVNGALISKRITYEIGMATRTALNPQLYTNVYLQYRGDHINLGIGVRDLYNNEYEYVQPFDSGIRELPGRGPRGFRKGLVRIQQHPLHGQLRAALAAEGAGERSRLTFTRTTT
ncbi:MAG: TonB-dependent receptor [Myxococcales bacterium]|nr:TonB-dependent receptor [Myxococcales bacterium]